MNPVVHFEMPAEDRDRMAKFYAEAFGWQANKLGSDMGNYVVVTTSETGSDGFPTKPGRINGGFFMRTKDNQYPSIVIGVEDIHAAMKKVSDAGGKIIGASQGLQPDDIPGIELYISIEDSEGNRVSLLQPHNMVYDESK